MGFTPEILPSFFHFYLPPLALPVLLEGYRLVVFRHCIKSFYLRKKIFE